MSDYNARAEAAVMERGGKLKGHEIVFPCLHPENHKNGDKTPSANYNPAKGVWICRVCHAHGNAYQLLKTLEKENGQVSNQWAITPHVTKKRFDRPGEKKTYLYETDGQTGLNGLPVDSLPLFNAQALEDNVSLAIVSEGEQAGESGMALGFVSVASVCGAGTIPCDASLKPLADRRGEVVLLPDNDDAGRKHMTGIANALSRLGKRVKIVSLPVGPKGDIRDFILAGGTKEQLEALIAEAPLFEGEAESPLDDTLHDVGNAKRFIRQYGHKVRYNKERDLWLIYNGKYWEWDENLTINKLAKDTARTIYHEAAETTDADKQDSIAKHAKASQANMRIKAMLEQARPDVAVKVCDFNTNQYLLNVANGTINLKTGELQPHDPNDLITCYIPVEYDPEAKSSLFDTFLNRTFEDNQAIIHYVKKSLGYCLTGDQTEQALWFNKGSGFNGKSTLYGAVKDILADYAGEIDPIAFMVDKNAHTGPNEALASLYGKRFVISVEIKTAMRLNVSLIKRMTGGESIRCERKFEHGFDFKPTHKLWILANSDPRIDDDTNSIYLRLKYLNFNVTIPEGERDRKLRANLVKNEGKAILAWLVDGCRLWQLEGLQDPPEVKEAVATYRDSQDILHDYLAENCITGAGETGLVSEQYKNYLEWARENNFDPMGKISFNGKLKDKGYKIFPGNRNKQTWRGIRPLSGTDIVRSVKSVNENPNLSSDFGSCIETSEKSVNKTNTINTENSEINTINQVNQLDLPDCPACGLCDWTMTPDGKYLVCSCGNKIEG